MSDRSRSSDGSITWRRGVPLGRSPEFPRIEGRRQQAIGIGGLLFAQMSDLLVTVYGLSLPGVVELNPIAVLAMDTLGTVAGLTLLSVVVLTSIVAVTEVAVGYCEGTPIRPIHVRCLGYLPLILVSLGAAAHNLFLIDAV